MSKSSLLQSYKIVLYRRALHPEFFNIQERRHIAHNDYELEAWLMPGGHVLRFQCNGLCFTEIITPDDRSLPERGQIAALPCAGERDHEQEFPEKVNYITTAQTETLTDHLFDSSYQEMLDFARETGALTHEWIDDDGGRCLSMIDIQRYKREVHVQSYHLNGGCGLILRSQTIFEQTD
ncbi:MAG TPA: hypothetical protein ENJ06_04445 [Phycisphaeraceae bacterium]|nr:hypothetical protein [Phycisphaeraceae bacterium]